MFSNYLFSRVQCYCGCFTGQSRVTRNEGSKHRPPRSQAEAAYCLVWTGEDDNAGRLRHRALSRPGILNRRNGHTGGPGSP